MGALHLALSFVSFVTFASDLGYPYHIDPELPLGLKSWAEGYSLGQADIGASCSFAIEACLMRVTFRSFNPNLSFHLCFSADPFFYPSAASLH